jgi:hypothetical protein
LEEAVEDLGGEGWGDLEFFGEEEEVGAAVEAVEAVEVGFGFQVAFREEAEEEREERVRAVGSGLLGQGEADRRGLGGIQVCRVIGDLLIFIEMNVRCVSTTDRRGTAGIGGEV